MRIVWRALTLALLLVSLSAPALADEGDPPRSYGTVRISAFSGFPDTFSISGSFTWLRPFELEAGVNTVLLASGGYVRMGYAVPLYSGRNKRARGWEVALPFLAGYRFMQSVPFDTAKDFHAINGVIALDANYWVYAHFGLNLQLNLGASFWVERTDEDTPPAIPEIRLAFGVSF